MLGWYEDVIILGIRSQLLLTTYRAVKPDACQANN
jgi:hypothetical protein